MKLEFHGLTDKGKKRKINEDSYIINRQNKLCIICDGVGSSIAGDLVSQIATDSIAYIMNKFIVFQFPQTENQKLPLRAFYFTKSIQMTNKLLFTLSTKYVQLRGMSTTVCSILFDDEIAYIAHAGDTRAYCINNDKLVCLTRDHSYVMSLLEDKDMNISELKKFKDRNIIIRALGIKPDVDIDLRIQPISNTIKLFLLCTDGLWGVVDDVDIEKICIDDINNPIEICKKLIDIANKQGGPDNITVSVIKVSGIKSVEKNLEGEVIQIRGIHSLEINKSSFENKLFKEIFSKYELFISKDIRNKYKKNILNKILKISFTILIIPMFLLFIDLGMKFLKLNKHVNTQIYNIKIDNYIPETKLKLIKNNSIIIEAESPLLNNIEPGIYQLKLSKIGYDEKNIQVSIVTNSVIIDGKLEQLAKLTLNLDTFVFFKLGNYKVPIESLIFIDNKETDITIQKLCYGKVTISISIGEHKISIIHNNTVYWEKNIKIEKDKNNVIVGL